jgi:hypothetical protein
MVDEVIKRNKIKSKLLHREKGISENSTTKKDSKLKNQIASDENNELLTGTIKQKQAGK